MTVNVDFQALLRASTEWADQGDQLAEGQLARRLDPGEPGYRADPGRGDPAVLSRPLSAGRLVRAATVGMTRL